MHDREESSRALLIRRVRVALHIPKYWHDDPRNEPPQGSWIWHVHHAFLVERVGYGGVGRRAEYIRRAKDLDEIDTRLRWMTVVKDQHAIDVIESRRRDEIGQISQPKLPAMDASTEAWDEYQTSYEHYLDECHDIAARASAALEAVHKAEHPGCPWDGRTLFPHKPI